MQFKKFFSLWGGLGAVFLIFLCCAIWIVTSNKYNKYNIHYVVLEFSSSQKCPVVQRELEEVAKFNPRQRPLLQKIQGIEFFSNSVMRVDVKIENVNDLSDVINALEFSFNQYGKDRKPSCSFAFRELERYSREYVYKNNFKLLVSIGFAFAFFLLVFSIYLWQNLFYDFKK